ncbi:MAG TPA: phenylalanine--tRNA ligase subunit beta, partial [Terriglobia bacterium]|nr:phenylalanine--tRNA ligase subunit beta [Terriglobia bacterium]
RPINNVADVTNYVLMELGHPLHAFDLSRLAGHRIVVRRARPGETLKLLDGVTRALTVENLVIADAERPVALAGVMGGEESAITATTHSVLLESAWFDPVSIRRTAKMHGLHTDASHRFERGADIEMAPLALDRAAELIRELAGGEILRGMVDVYPKPQKRERIFLRRSEILRILGAEAPAEDVERILPPLGFAVESEGAKEWSVTPPSFRLDVTRPVDLIEEVARHFGYDRLPARLIPAPPRAERDLLREKELALSQRLVSLGYREIITTSMIDPAENLKFSGSQSVVLENPLSQEASALRTSMIPTMIAALRWNLDRYRGDLRFYEFGKVYCLAPDGAPKERRVLALGLTGNRRSVSVHESAKAADFFDLKGDLESLWELFDLGQMIFASDGNDAYESGIHGRFLMGDKALAAFGQLAAKTSAAYRLRQAVFVAEIDLDTLLDYDLRVKTFRPYSKFPAVVRDLSLLVPKGVSYQSVAEAIQSLGLPDLAEFRPADLFRGGAAGSERYSLLLRLTFQSSTHTLTSEEVAAASRKIVEALERIGVRLRA